MLIHKKKLNNILIDFESGIHYDIYPTFNEDINIILFEILFFKCINDGDSGLYYINLQKPVFYLEIS